MNDTGGITSVVAQLRTQDLERTIRFYTEILGFTLDFRYEDFYAGVRAGNSVVHLKLDDSDDPSIDYVKQRQHFHLYLETPDVAAAAEDLQKKGIELTEQVHETAWGTKEFVIEDDQGHTLYFGQRTTQ
ncbi:MAG TPA: VOC family protein [Candidatus Tumulicola sp.]|jgi:catechol 2,3-dioxygenase-like lactoylglutathione lyase family enzyme